MPEVLDQSPDPSELCPRNTSLERRANSSSTRSLEWRQIQDSSWGNEITSAQQHRNCVAPTCQISAHECTRYYRREEEYTTTNIFDDDEWIRYLTEAQETTAYIQEERITHAIVSAQ